MNAFQRNWAFYCIQVEEDKTSIYSLKQGNRVRINDKISIEMNSIACEIHCYLCPRVFEV